MPEELHRWIVDVLDAHAATVEVDGERTIELPRWLLPDDAREGDVLTVRHDRGADESRLVVEIDRPATRAAMDVSREQMARAPLDTSTGDITL
jgi:hypothetical protein